jgi:hypothetical protein
MRLSFIFPSSAPWIIFGTSFQSSQHTEDVVLLKLCNDFVPPITQVHNFPEVTKGGESDFTYYRVSLEISCKKERNSNLRKWTDRIAKVTLDFKLIKQYFLLYSVE